MIYGYTRVSTARQAERESLETQAKQLQGYALSQDLPEPKIISDQVSGSIPLQDRPSNILALVKPEDIIICTKLDRMFRSALDALKTLEDLKAKNISLHFIDLGGNVTTNGIGQLVFTILAAVAQAERERIKDRIREVKAKQKSENAYLGGGIPFGYKIRAGKLELDPNKQPIKKFIERSDLPIRKIKQEVYKQHGVTISLSTILRIKHGAES